MAPASNDDLERMRNTLGLSDDELARMAGIEGLIELTVALRRRFLPERIPTIVRTSQKGLKGRTVLQTTEEDGVDEVFVYLTRLFSYIPQGFPSLRRSRIERALSQRAVEYGLDDDAILELAEVVDDSIEHRNQPRRESAFWTSFSRRRKRFTGQRIQSCLPR